MGASAIRRCGRGGMQLWSLSCVVGCDICAKMTP